MNEEIVNQEQIEMGLFQKWIKTYLIVLCRSFDFKGRSSRLEYWNFVLTNLTAYVLSICGFFMFFIYSLSHGASNKREISGFVDMLFKRSEITALLISILFIFIVVSSIIPKIFLLIRRLHDVNFSGLIIILNFIPIVNFFSGLFCLVVPFFASKDEDNKYGDNSTALMNGFYKRSFLSLLGEALLKLLGSFFIVGLLVFLLTVVIMKFE